MMEYSSYIVSLFSVFLCLLSLAACDGKDCKEIARKIDKGFREFAYIDPDVPIPKTPKEVVSHCRKGERAIKGLKKYKSQCANSFSAQIMSIAIGSVTRSFDALCSEENHERTIKINKCLSPKGLTKTQECFKHAEKAMGWISKNGNQTHILPMTCCGYNILDECVKNAVESSCPDEGDFKPVKFLVNLLTQSMEEVREFACAQVRTIALCKSKHPWCTRQIKRVWSQSARGRSGGPKPQGMVFAMIQISNTLSSV
ncbi:uncharacterized protein LOC141849943 [Brevipalpus obovatus]|uniref:uncharacterized protein LOC141849943 n=1 Tax=Brevipalpus obovatus TaxID=246614 RepID=UPI003D9DC491